MKNCLKKMFVKKYYWYHVRFIYKDKANKEILNFVSDIGLVYQNEILKHRNIKKILKPLHVGELKNYKRYLVNGKLEFEVICYLGRFSKHK